jgi:hypothetical protein
MGAKRERHKTKNWVTTHQRFAHFKQLELIDLHFWREDEVNRLATRGHPAL